MLLCVNNHHIVRGYEGLTESLLLYRKKPTQPVQKYSFLKQSMTTMLNTYSKVFVVIVDNVGSQQMNITRKQMWVVVRLKSWWARTPWCARCSRLFWLPTPTTTTARLSHQLSRPRNVLLYNTSLAPVKTVHIFRRPYIKLVKKYFVKNLLKICIRVLFGWVGSSFFSL